MVSNLFDLHGKVAIVTGCNTGLGQAVAIGLAEAGADIGGVYRSDPADTRRQIESLGRQFVGIEADLSSVKPVQRIVNQAVAAFSKIDILVNNAGIIRRCDALEFTEKDWDDVLNINLKVLFFLSQAVARQFVKQGTGGKIINIASMLSYQGGILVSSYTASKSGVLGLTRALANEWAKHNINVNAIAPGYMITKNTEQLRKDRQRYESITARIPSGRWGQPEDLKGTAIFLASDASAYLQGFTIAVDGGWLAR
jgi:2-deoxy-D-gluconate 3-dehydrogenase